MEFKTKKEARAMTLVNFTLSMASCRLVGDFSPSGSRAKNENG